MARGKGARLGKRGKTAEAPPADDAANPARARSGGLPLPSPVAGTNLVIADVVLRAAGGLLRDRMEKGLLVRGYDQSKADKLVDGRSMAASVALWGASHLARRSPLGLAVVAGGLAAKVFYDRGKRLEARRRTKKVPTDDS
jgi:hypothetical protein